MTELDAFVASVAVGTLMIDKIIITRKKMIVNFLMITISFHFDWFGHVCCVKINRKQDNHHTKKCVYTYSVSMGGQ